MPCCAVHVILLTLIGHMGVAELLTDAALNVVQRWRVLLRGVVRYSKVVLAMYCHSCVSACACMQSTVTPHFHCCWSMQLRQALCSVLEVRFQFLVERDSSIAQCFPTGTGKAT